MTVEQSGAANPAVPAPRDPACNAVHNEQAPVPVAADAAGQDLAIEANPGALQSVGVEVTPFLGVLGLWACGDVVGSACTSRNVFSMKSVYLYMCPPFEAARPKYPRIEKNSW